MYGLDRCHVGLRCKERMGGQRRPQDGFRPSEKKGMVEPGPSSVPPQAFVERRDRRRSLLQLLFHDVKQFNLEHQCGARFDLRRSASISIGQR